MPEIHARFSPSAANRRIHCPPSLLLEEQFEEGESVYAAEGTAGHAMAEHIIRKYLGQRILFMTARSSPCSEGASFFRRATCSGQSVVRVGWYQSESLTPPP